MKMLKGEKLWKERSSAEGRKRERGGDMKFCTEQNKNLRKTTRQSTITFKQKGRAEKSENTAITQPLHNARDYSLTP